MAVDGGATNGHTNGHANGHHAATDGELIPAASAAAAAADTPAALAASPAEYEEVFRQLQPYISTQVLVPPGRLMTLLRQVGRVVWQSLSPFADPPPLLPPQAMVLQRRDCLYHNVVKDTFTLLQDHRCSRDGIPRHTTRILVGHSDEVWRVSFSRSGHMLATGSRCGM